MSRKSWRSSAHCFFLMHLLDLFLGLFDPEVVGHGQHVVQRGDGLVTVLGVDVDKEVGQDDAGDHGGLGL